MPFLLDLVRYQSWSFRATWPPLLLCLAAIALAVGLGPIFPPAYAIGAVGAGLLVFDAAARLRQAEAIRDLIQRHNGLTGPALSQFRQARASWCSRRAALAAAHSAGCGGEARALVLKWGYKPWHVFPDGAFSRRSPFLQTSFWRSVMGLPRRR
ncbi:hypothetical protein [Maricaulis sp.]|uniref:hypothetical protein n=1 Tax=Maricaulis sp. TaxID=1486257 RepID=UPI0026075F5A|nr:hypothetical protein [Maricaulis sp.]